MKKIYFLLFVVVMVACKDDDPKLTVEQYLTAAKDGWVYESVLLTLPGTSVQVDALKDPQFADFFEACTLDDATIFTTDGKYTVANNTKCDPSDDTTLDSGTWALNSDKSSLTISSASDDPFTLTKLSVDGGRLQGELSEFFGIPVSATIIMKHK